MKKFVYVLDYTARVAESPVYLGGVAVLVSPQKISSEQFQALVDAAIRGGAWGVQDVTDFLVGHYGFQKVDFVRAAAEW